MSCYIVKHHGIMGMHWGITHGPPYPLSAKKSAAIKQSAKADKSRSKKSQGSDHNDETTEKSGRSLQLTDKQKKAVKIGAVVAVGLLATYGAYKLSSSGKFGTIGDSADSSKTLTLGNLKKKTVKMSAEEDLARINPGYPVKSGSQNNCMFCTTAYELRRRGFDVSANTRERGGPFEDINRWFKNPEYFSDFFESAEELKDHILSNCENGARGNMGISGVRKRDGLPWHHSVIWEVINGDVVIRDGQSNRTFTSVKEAVSFFESNGANIDIPEGVRIARLDKSEILDDILETIKESKY